VSFRARLLTTLHELQPILDVDGVMIVGSQVPNLLEPGAAATLVVSQDVDIAVPVERHGAVKARLGALRRLRPSADEPSVWLPDGPELIEANFLGIDRTIRTAGDTYVREDRELPLMVFGPLSLVQRGQRLELAGLRLPLPRPAGLLLEKLLTDRSGVKGDRDLLVALALILLAEEGDLTEVDVSFRGLGAEERHAVTGNLAVLSLLEALPGMPDPKAGRASVEALLRSLEAITGEVR
jgi:hypothetical protein